MNRCVCCGAIIPEGRQVCRNCEKDAERKEATKKGDAVCHVYCKPCDWFGVCPHSYAEFDRETMRENQ